MRIGVDDTDSPLGGCTTYTLTEIVRRATDAGFDLLGEPRLVRLDPNVPTKTRGNAALAARFGRGRGPRRRQGAVDGRTVWSYARGEGARGADAERLVTTAWEAVRATSRTGEPGTDPVLVASTDPLPSSIYREAVGRWTDPGEVTRCLAAHGATILVDGDPGGVVGAAAALAWPARRATWELLAYRAPARWGSARSVDAASVRRAARADRTLFLCDDARTRRLLVVPHTPCPILFGVRGREARRLPRTLARIRSEPVDRWLLFRTNQGTGDHAIARAITDLRPYDAASLRGTVVAAPEVRRGGHVGFEMIDGGATPLACVAFEPTKTLPAVARALRPGDRIRVWGGRGADPTFRLEGIQVLRLAPPVGSAPACRRCGRRASSLGRLRGYRCRTCGSRIPPERAGAPPPRRFPVATTYHPTASARRHLAPLPRGRSEPD